MNVFWETRIGSLIASGGLIWCAHEATKHLTNLAELRVPMGGPAELVALGIVIWLHAKYRNSITAR